jgi:hypothetical protein
MTDQQKIPKLPKALEDFADTVLRYRPKPKSEPAKKRKRRAAKVAREGGRRVDVPATARAYRKGLGNPR